MIKLNKLELNKEGIIYSIDNKMSVKRRLYDIGLTKGTVIKPVLLKKRSRVYIDHLKGWFFNAKIKV